MNIRLLAALFVSLFVVACAQEGESTADVAAPTGPLVGDPDKGKRFYILCQACHTINSGGMNKIGPNLHGIIGAPAAQVEGFVYSEALTNAGITWDDEALDQWITRPAEMVPGTTMVFLGVNDPQQRADLIAYLETAAAE